MGTEYKVVYRKMVDRSDALESILKSWRETLIKVDSKVSVLKKSDSISGATADRMRQYFNEIHDQIGESLFILLEMVRATWDSYYTGYTNSIDPHPDTKIIISHVENIKNKMNSFCDESAEIDNDVTRILNSIKDVYDCPYSRNLTDATIYEKNA